MDRRKFLKYSAQATIAVSISALSGFLLFRERTNEVCELDFACKQCKKTKECGLPEAKAFRNK